MDRLPLTDADTLWFTGDLVNRGPQSLGTLRFIRSLGSRARIVLGNHDLHLLCLAEGLGKAREDDTVEDILRAPDREDLLDWLRQQPLAIYEAPYLMVHAGVLPQWTSLDVVLLAGEVSRRLQGPQYHAFLTTLYGNEPRVWDARLALNDRHRLIVNALTRLRVTNTKGDLDLSFKGEASKTPPGRLPWFEFQGRQTAEEVVVFGHWSALGLLLRTNLIGLDTGCVWGRQLTAVRLEDREVFSVEA